LKGWGLALRLALDAVRAQPAPRQQHNAGPGNDFLRRLAIADEPLTFFDFAELKG
jgi:hypothetical protein